MNLALPYTLLAIDNKETVLAGDTLVAGAATPEATAPGLLANDYFIFSDGSVGTAEFPTVSVYNVTIGGAVYLAQAFISDSYGDWSFYTDGVYHFIANGISVKKLADGEMATIVSPYTIMSDSGASAQADLIINVIGRYDPPEVSSSGSLLNEQITESQWLSENQFNIATGQGRKWYGPTIQLDFYDNNSNIVVTGFVKEFRSSGQAGLISDPAAIQNFLNGEITSGVEPGSSPDTYQPYFQINTDNFSLLNETEGLEIVFAATVSDGKSPSQTIDLGSITIFGDNNAPFAHDEAVNLISGQSVAADTDNGALANDFDADSQHQLQVTGAGYGSEFKIIDPTVPIGSVTVQGAYCTLQLFSNGYYFIHDDGRYTDNRNPWSQFTETFIYQIQDDRGAPGVTDGELIVNVLPNPESRVVQHLLKSAYDVSEDDGLPVPGLDGWNAISINIEPIKVFSKSDDLSGLSLKFLSVADSNPLYAGQTLDQMKLSLLGSANLVFPTLNIVQNSDSTLGSIWQADLNASFHLVTNADPQAEIFLGFGMDMLNEGERVELTYSLVAGESTLDSQFIKIVISGKNDAPVLVDLSDQLFSGQTIVRTAAQGLLSEAFDIDSADQIQLIEVSADSASPTAPGIHSSAVSPGNDAVIAGLYGSLTVHADGSYQYTANLDAVLEIQPNVPSFDVFTYRVNDLHGDLSAAQLKIRVFSPADLPVTQADEMTVNLDNLAAANPAADLIGNVLANDLPPNAGALHVNWTMGDVTGFVTDDSGNVYIDPDSFVSLKHGAHQDVEFFYTVSNDISESDPVHVLVHVIGSNEAPVASSDTYAYENTSGSILSVSEADGLLLHRDVGELQDDTDADGDPLAVSAVFSEEGGDPLSLVNGQVSLLKDGVTFVVHSNGQFTVDAPDGFIGMVSFAYEVSDGLASETATAYIDIGGSASLAGLLVINEISLATGPVIRYVTTDNGAAPDGIKVGNASIELFNSSDHAITASELAGVTLQIRGPDGGLTDIGFDQLTGLTADKNGNALSKLAIPAHGMLMIYEPGTSGFGTWSLYQSGAKYAFISSGSYQGAPWELSTDVTHQLAVNLSQNETSIDFFAANGADTAGFSGVIGIESNASAGIPWTGSDLSSTIQTTQFNAALSSDKETVFSRVDYTDGNNASDWGTTTRAGLTLGNVNLKGTITSPTFIANPLDPLESLNQLQGMASTEGQLVIASTDGSDEGGDNSDVLIGSSQDDTLDGLAHNDYLEGGGGNDTLRGGSGGDVLLGGAGNDALCGGTGKDRMTGGDGNDLFIYLSVKESNGALADEIEDFRHGEDKIDLSAIDANLRAAGEQSFVWGGHSLQTRANSVTWHEENGKTIVTADVTVDTVPDLKIVLQGVGLQLQATDFIF